MQRDSRHTERNLAIELAGTAASMTVGAVLGLLIPLKGEGAVTNAIVFSLIAWLFWTRRHYDPRSTLVVALATTLLLWPLAFALLDWLHYYF